MNQEHEPKKETEYIDEFADSAKVQIDKIRKKLKKTQKDAKEYLNGWQRERADFANYKKEISTHLEDGKRYIKEDMIIDFLKVMDNFELMAKHASSDIQKTDWFGGVEQSSKQMLGMLRRYEVEEIKVKSGDKFDPSLHWAVDGKGEVISEVLQKGYKMGKKVLRPAKVKVKSK